MTTDSPPTVADELDRKAFETVDYLVRRHGLGELTDDALSQGLQTVWQCAAGLVTEGTKQIIVEALKTVRKPRRAQTRVFRDPASGEVRYIVDWTPGENTVGILDARSGKLALQTLTSASIARNAFAAICGKLAITYQEFGA